MGNKEKLKLNDFINMLNDKIGFSFDIDNFDHGLKLQKYVFLAKYFEFKHNYHYNLYIRGPYSSDLADDYYDIFHDKLSSDNSLEMSNEFFDLVKDKNIDWLESATTMLSLYDDYTHEYSQHNDEDDKRISLVIDTKKIKSHIDTDIIKNVYDNLRCFQLLN